MGGLLDLLFLGILVYFLLRGVGKATERSGGPAERAPPSPPRPRAERPASPPPTTGPERVRDRLMEELRRWEAEQRSQGERFEHPSAGRTTPAASPPSEATAPVEREEVFSYDDAVEGPAPEPSRVAPRPPDRRVERPVPEPLRVLPEPEPARADRLRVAAREGGVLELERLSPLQRAVVWGEVLGPPRGLGR